MASDALDPALDFFSRIPMVPDGVTAASDFGKAAPLFPLAQPPMTILVY
jgi:hypothetical protein